MARVVRMGGQATPRRAKAEATRLAWRKMVGLHLKELKEKGEGKGLSRGEKFIGGGGAGESAMSVRGRWPGTCWSLAGYNEERRWGGVDFASDTKSINDSDCKVDEGGGSSGRVWIVDVGGIGEVWSRWGR
ncbi:hypothetical protein E2562_014812 [Oryza meyeriana var. granulata]|uniref:Uncharacterized protein n=1 Tax=Oryza meyeriana var. granulata TaxID=110450 RepID=A0A6G1BWP0_9ORYZ|nr:hypothetical protein E2562_014812 [Oryza meyeriana var. granulata]